MRYFFDTEFIEDGKTIDLLSIGIIKEDKQSLYACNRDAKLDAANEWVIFNVYPHLNVGKGPAGWHWKESDRKNDQFIYPKDQVVVPRTEIRNRIQDFVGDDKSPEFWGYYSDYDWVAFCQLWGRMVDLPGHFPKYCLDLKQAIFQTRFPRVTSQPDDMPHHALSDANWIRQSFLELYPK